MKIEGLATITVFYTCSECQVTDAAVTVPARRPGSSIDAFMQDVIGRAAADHRRRSPTCSAKEMQELRIPINTKGNHPIGAPRDN